MGAPLDNRYIDPEYAAELAHVLRLMAAGDFSRTWTTVFGNSIWRAPRIIEVAANQIERFGELRPPPPPEAAPSGRVLVPLEPTAEMLAALSDLGRALVSDVHERDHWCWFAVKAYRAMIAAAPSPQTQGEE